MFEHAPQQSFGTLPVQFGDQLAAATPIDNQQNLGQTSDAPPPPNTK
jgi:hypothetical protein